MHADRKIEIEPENFDINLPDKNSNKFYARDFGVLPGSVDAGILLQSAIDFCSKNTPCTLVLDKGEYRFDSGNHLEFNAIENFIFEGNYSDFVFSSQEKSFISIKDCFCSSIQNISIDWDWNAAKLASIGKIIHVDIDFSFFDVQFTMDETITNCMNFTCFTPLHKTNHTIGFCDGKEFGSDYLYEKIDKINNNTLRFYINIKDRMDFLRIGQLYMIRHFTYEVNAFSMIDNSHLTLKNITVFSVPGHAYVVNGHQHHWQLINCKLTKKPGTDRCISATADGHHVVNSNGYFKMEDCDFGFNGDDCVNIHSNSKMGYLKIDNRTIRIEYTAPWKNPYEKGNIIEFRNNDLSPTGFKCIIVDVIWNYNNSVVDLLLDRDIIIECTDSKIIFNLSYQSDHYIIRNNIFHQNRARGVLAHSNFGLIENNRFFMNMGPGLQMECGCEERWAEGYGINNVLVRNNYFDTCDTSHWSMACIYLGCYLPDGRTDYAIFHDIFFENNTFINMPGAAIYLSSCSDISFSNNTLINVCTKNHITGDELYAYDVDKGRNIRYQGAIILDRATDCNIDNNKLIYTIPVSDMSIYASNETTENIIIDNNQGFYTAEEPFLPIRK